LAGYEKEAVTAAQEREIYLKNNPSIQKKKGKYVAKKGKLTNE
jgi:hypothetical protein